MTYSHRKSETELLHVEDFNLIHKFEKKECKVYVENFKLF